VPGGGEEGGAARGQAQGRHEGEAGGQLGCHARADRAEGGRDLQVGDHCLIIFLSMVLLPGLRRS
jgi:hypothetical protein